MSSGKVHELHQAAQALKFLPLGGSIEVYICNPRIQESITSLGDVGSPRPAWPTGDPTSKQ